MSGTIGAAIAAAAARLRAAGLETPERDARHLVGFAAGVAPDRLTLHLHDPFDADAALAAALAAREARRPVSQITGRRQFYGRDFRVTQDVLDPRPETEALVSAALEAPFRKVLDLGSGTGCILLTLLAERPAAEGIGVDISEAALQVARDNSAALGVPAQFRISDWYAAVPERFDLIVSNPPYIAASEIAELAPEVRNWEPRVALTDDGDGLSAYRAIAAGTPGHLRPGGRILVEVGPGQAARVADIFSDAGLDETGIRADLDGRDRVVLARAKQVLACP